MVPFLDEATDYTEMLRSLERGWMADIDREALPSVAEGRDLAKAHLQAVEEAHRAAQEQLAAAEQKARRDREAKDQAERDPVAQEEEQLDADAAPFITQMRDNGEVRQHGLAMSWWEHAAQQASRLYEGARQFLTGLWEGLTGRER